MLKSPFMGEGEGQFCNPSSREAGEQLKELRGSWCLLALPTQQSLLAAEEKQLAASCFFKLSNQF